MSQSKQSKHRHISFTAHYTGYIWYQMGISHEAFATKKGKKLAQLIGPIETFAEKYVGGSMRSTLKTRHTILDEYLTQLIQEHPDLQVLEIAAGLSPRGWWFRNHFPQIEYRELDLPDMAATKQAALNAISPDHPQVLSVDLFTEDFQTAFDVFDTQRPLVIVSEGLINYFNKELLEQLLSSISKFGKPFKALHYLTDLYPEPVHHKLANLIWTSSKLLKYASRSSFSFHFKNPLEVTEFFKKSEFKTVSVVQPQLHFGSDKTIVETEDHLGDLVWVVHAQR